ncbi:MAG TPA: ATP-grasp fold amidoligase family protein [Streptosporangiaceae bacterium]|nr:ATP-grasp fold amidoligase family protein [Streptosporangiaceae bacterium]
MSLVSRTRNQLQSLIYSLPIGLRRRLLFIYFNRRLPRFVRPRTFNEKVNWRILHDRRPLLEWTCDKLAMKDYALTVAPAGLNVPRTIWSGLDIGELQAIELPEHWVLKPNHRSGLVHFGSGRPDHAQLSSLTSAWLETFESKSKGEWAYAKARPMLVLEELMGVPGSPPADYKFFVFDGKVIAVQVDVDRHTRHKRRIYRSDWSPLDVKYGPHGLAAVTPPGANLSLMLAIAEDLGRPFDFIRVDLYDVDNVIQFGELTPYPSGGLDRFAPVRFDLELGNSWVLPRL